MNSSQFQKLVERYISEECSAEDIKTLQQLLKDPEYVSGLANIMDQQLTGNTSSAKNFPEVISRLKKAVSRQIQNEKPATVQRLPFLHRWMVAAAILILTGTTIYLWFFQHSSKPPDNISQTSLKAEIAPGKEGAILTLDDGRTVVLDSLGNGIIANQNGTKVILENGQVVYNANGSNDNIAFNTMTTPKGRQFRLQLQDGTQVWLNAASSIRYPIVFTGKERKVEVTGEVYFEVAKNAKMPFCVQVNDKMLVEVLGTHFNINSYKNEETVKITLLEGSVQINDENKKLVLKPGQQAQANEQLQNNKIRIVNDIDVEKVMAWKNGKFNFEDASLKEVMGQLERWYDIEVVYEKGVPDLEFIGKIGRELSLNEVLRGLEVSEVHFRLEGRKLVVMP